MAERSIVLSDGSEIEADLVVYATGYGSMNGWAAQLISLLLALQLKARFEGVPTPVHALADVHHKS